MAYATADHLRARLGHDLLHALADEDGDGEGDSEILETALDEAAEEIDGSIAGRYVVPVSPTPAVIRRINVELAIYYLLLRRRAAASAEYLRLFSDAREMLAAWAEGRADLAGASGRLDDFRADSTTLEMERAFDRIALEAF